MKIYGGVKVYLLTILDLGSRWRLVVSFTPRPLYSHEKSQRYPLNWRLDGSRTSLDGAEKRKSLAPARNRTPVVQPVARDCTY
jgi:hypothetical protein